MNQKETIARLKHFRKVRGVSARELSLSIGKHETYINKLELNGFALPMDVFFQILSALNVPSDEFFACDWQTTGHDRALYTRIVDLAPESKVVMLNMMSALR